MSATVANTPFFPAATIGDASTSQYYQPELDWLRFIAFLAVFASHAYFRPDSPLPSWTAPYPVEGLLMPFVRAGGYGVDLFFALSAFLITKLLLLERERTGRIHVSQFYLRRILRIWPLFFTSVLAMYLIDRFVRNLPTGYYGALAVFVGNWFAVYNTTALRTLALPMWSVCIEEQFYILWPHLVRWTNPIRFVMLMGALLTFSVLYRTMYVMGLPPHADSVWMNTLTRLDPFALGGLLAIVLHKRDIVRNRIQRALILAASIGLFWFLGNHIIWIGTEPASIWSSPISYLLAAMGSVLLLTVFVTLPPRSSYPPYLNLLSYLGKISYGLYVFHYPSLYLTDYFVSDAVSSGPLAFCLNAGTGGLLTFMLAAASYKWLEKPFLKLKRRFTYVDSRPE